MARVELRAVGGALAQMPDLQRNAILADLADDTTASPLASSARMLRMRARRRLQHLMDHASVLGVALGVQMRRAIREVELVLGRILPSDGERVTAAAISLVAALSLGVAVGPGSPGRTDEPRFGAGSSDGGGASREGGAARSSAATFVARGSELSRRERGPVGGRTASLEGSAPGSEPGTETQGGEEADDLPGATSYTLWVTEGTYVRGEIEVDVFGTGDPNKVRSIGRAAGRQLNCTVAPSHTGASCAASEDGSEYTGARAQHRSEARVAGRRV